MKIFSMFDTVLIAYINRIAPIFSLVIRIAL